MSGFFAASILTNVSFPFFSLTQFVVTKTWHDNDIPKTHIYPAIMKTYENNKINISGNFVLLIFMISTNRKKLMQYSL
jgi:hypothetical protein